MWKGARCHWSLGRSGQTLGKATRNTHNPMDYASAPWALGQDPGPRCPRSAREADVRGEGLSCVSSAGPLSQSLHVTFPAPSFTTAGSWKQLRVVHTELIGTGVHRRDGTLRSHCSYVDGGCHGRVAESRGLSERRMISRERTVATWHSGESTHTGQKRGGQQVCDARDGILEGKETAPRHLKGSFRPFNVHTSSKSPKNKQARCPPSNTTKKVQGRRESNRNQIGKKGRNGGDPAAKAWLGEDCGQSYRE